MPALNLQPHSWMRTWIGATVLERRQEGTGQGGEIRRGSTPEPMRNRTPIPLLQEQQRTGEDGQVEVPALSERRCGVEGRLRFQGNVSA